MRELYAIIIGLKTKNAYNCFKMLTKNQNCAISIDNFRNIWYIIMLVKQIKYFWVKYMKLSKKQLIIIISAASAIFLALIIAIVAIALRNVKDTERTEYVYGDYTYVLTDDNRVEIIKYSGTETDVSVPTAIDSRSVVSIADGAFLGNKMRTLKLGLFVERIGDSAFYSCTSLESITFSSDIKTIGDYAFYMCNSLKELVLPKSVTEIGTSAFNQCSSLKSVELPDGVKEIDDYAFYMCKSLETIPFDEITHIGDYAFYGCKAMVQVSLPAVIEIGELAFSNCTALTSMTIGSSASSIDSSFMNGNTSAETITVDEANTRYSTSSGALTDMTDKHVMYMPANSSLSAYTLPADTLYIDNYAFYGCESLTKIILSDSLVRIGDYAFNLCVNLERIVLSSTSDGINCDFPSSIKDVGGLAFYGTKFKNNLPSGFTVVGDGVLIAYIPFKDASGKYIDGEGTKVVSGMVNISGANVNKVLGVEVTLPDSVKRISSAFAYSTDVVSVTAGASVSEISDYAFYHAIALETVDLSSTSVKVLGDCVFSSAIKLENVSLPSNLIDVGEMLFMGCTSLKSIEIPKSLTYIGHSMFFECSALENVILHNDIKSIGDYAFSRNNAMKTIDLPTSLVKIPNPRQAKRMRG